MRGTLVEAKRKRPPFRAAFRLSPRANKQLVSRDRLADFLCLSLLRWSQSVERQESVFCNGRFLFQDHFTIELRHTCVMRGIVLDLFVAGADFLLARGLCDAELVEIVLHFVRDDLVAQG